MDKIIHDVWIGNEVESYKNGNEFDLIVDCRALREEGQYDRDMKHRLIRPIFINAPILISITDPNNRETYTDTYVDPVKMTFIADVLSRFKKEKKILVHCAAGEERSPLAVIWWIYDRMEVSGVDLIRAYEFVKSKHPQTLQRLEWLKKLIPPPLYKMEGE